MGQKIKKPRVNDADESRPRDARVFQFAYEVLTNPRARLRVVNLRQFVPWIATMGALGVLVLVLALMHHRAEKVPEMETIHNTQPVEGAASVKVGFYVNRISDLDVTSRKFSADFYLWLIWPGPVENIPKFEFINAHEVKELHRYEASHNDDKDLSYISLRYRGEFYTEMDFTAYPFDRQKLRIVIEDQDAEVDTVRYEIDPGSRIHENVNVDDWRIVAVRALHDVHTYETNWGYDIYRPEEAKPATIYSSLHLEIEIARLEAAFLAKSVLPLLLILLVSCLVFAIDCSHGEIRNGFCVTILLGAIALHLSATQAFANAGSLTAIDELYLVGYAFLALITAQVVYTTHLVSIKPERATWLNRVYFRFVPAALLLTFAFVCWARSSL